MTVSVIIPVYNGSAHLKVTLDSVLAQTHAPDEIIIVDDGSTDSSPEILRAYGDRLRVIRQHNHGVATARNVGLAHASGDLICFLDQDDLWPENRTRLLVDALQADPEAQVAAGLVKMQYERPTPPPSGENLATLHREHLLGSICVRSALFRVLGQFNTGIGYADDTDFMIRRQEAGTKTLYLDAVTLVYRIHASNTSADAAERNFHFMGALRESLKRRRGKNGRAHD